MRKIAELPLYFVYMVLAATLVPLPTDPFPVMLGQRYDPLLIAGLGAFGNGLSALLEYGILSALFRRGKLGWLQKSPRLTWIRKKLRRHLVWGLLVANATGLFPSDAVRILAIVERLHPALLFFSVTIGRLPRYYVLARLGEFLSIPPGWVFLLVALLLLWAGYRAWQEKHLVSI